jgi:hypothetical protein
LILRGIDETGNSNPQEAIAVEPPFDTPLALFQLSVLIRLHSKSLVARGGGKVGYSSPTAKPPEDFEIYSNFTQSNTGRFAWLMASPSISRAASCLLHSQPARQLPVCSFRVTHATLSASRSGCPPSDGFISISSVWKISKNWLAVNSAARTEME